MEYYTYTKPNESDEGLLFLKDYFDADPDIVDEFWVESHQNLEEAYDKLMEIGCTPKAAASGDIIEEMYKFHILYLVLK